LGEAELNLKTNTLELGQELLLGSIRQVRKVMLADSYDIPPLSEKIIDVYVQRNERVDNSTYLIEPNGHFLGKKSTYDGKLFGRHK
jgi:hypothetical protein